MQPDQQVLILTPVKNAARHLEGYLRRVSALDYPALLLSVGLLESDSTDDTWRLLRSRLPALQATFRSAGIWKRDFGFSMPPDLARWSPNIQLMRRSILARSRNHLLFHALDDEDWVLWLDVDVIEYPADIIQRLLAAGRDIVHPHCVCNYGGQTFDQNGWRDHGRQLMQHMRGGDDLVPLDAVGGTMLLINADLHRDGLIFPSYLYGRASAVARSQGEVETEGLGIMAKDMGHQPWGMPNLEIRHARE
jgi:glycosyltransferase involved in cell wall biosynthesis